MLGIISEWIKRHKTFVFGGLFVILAGIYFYRWIHRPLTLQEHAKIALAAVLAKDGQTVLDYLFEEEIESNSMDERMCVELLELIHRPVEGYERSGPVLVNEGGMSSQGIATQEFRKGSQLNSISVTVLDVDDRPRMSISSLLLSSWGVHHAEGRVIYPKDNMKVAAYAYRQGLIMQAEQLRSIGFTKFITLNYNQGTIHVWSIEEGIRHFDEMLAAPEQSGSPTAR